MINLKLEISNIKSQIRPYSDVLIFMVTLLVANFAWKWTMVGDEGGEMVTWLGLDVTAPFEWLSAHIAAVVFWLVSLCRDTVYMVGDHLVRFENGGGSNIVWSCSGLKQMFIWTCLILTVRGGWKHKIWFIPLGLLCCHVFNILRIFMITLIVEHHQEWFGLMHDHICKYLFYGMMFALWVWFVEGIRGPLTQQQETQNK